MEKKIRDALKELGISEESTPWIDFTNLEGLVDGLILLARANVHDRICLQREIRRLEGIRDGVVLSNIQLEEIKVVLEERNQSLSEAITSLVEKIKKRNGLT